MKDLVKNCWRGLVTVFILFMALTISFSAAQASETDKWEFNINLYLWGASIGGETALGSGVDVEFKDLFDNREMVFMGGFGARKGKWSFLADVVYMNVSKSDTINNLVPVRGELESWVVTPAVAYTVVSSQGGNLDIMGGARYLYMHSDRTIGPFQSAKSEDIWDAIVGLRGNINLSKRWYLPYHLDIGTGGSDFTWQGLLGIGYHFKPIDLVAGYRHLEWDFDDGTALMDLNFAGPFVGIKIKF